jgi:hypothetical protein
MPLPANISSCLSEPCFDLNSDGLRACSSLKRCQHFLAFTFILPQKLLVISYRADLPSLTLPLYHHLEGVPNLWIAPPAIEDKFSHFHNAPKVTFIHLQGCWSLLHEVAEFSTYVFFFLEFRAPVTGGRVDLVRHLFCNSGSLRRG